MRSGNLRLVPASSEIVAKELEGEVIIVNMSNGIYYSLNAIGSFVWSCSKEGQSLDSICGRLMRRYSNAPVANDVEKFVNRLIDEEIAALKEPATADERSCLDDMLPADYVVAYITTYDDVADMIALDPPLPEPPQYNRNRD